MDDDLSATQHEFKVSEHIFKLITFLSGDQDLLAIYLLLVDGLVILLKPLLHDVELSTWQLNAGIS